VVLAASYEAKSFGVSSGMSGWRARELCPQLIFVGGHFEDYGRRGDAAIDVLNAFLPKSPRSLFVWRSQRRFAAAQTQSIVAG
jgi:impB/mucB/samB family